MKYKIPVSGLAGYWCSSSLGGGTLSNALESLFFVLPFIGYFCTLMHRLVPSLLHSFFNESSLKSLSVPYWNETNEKPDSCGSPGSLFSWYQEISPKSLNQVLCCSRSVICLQLKSDGALNTTSLKCCLALSDAIDRREKCTHAYMVQGRLMQALFIEIH